MKMFMQSQNYYLEFRGRLTDSICDQIVELLREILLAEGLIDE